MLKFRVLAQISPPIKFFFVCVATFKKKLNKNKKKHIKNLIMSLWCLT